MSKYCSFINKSGKKTYGLGKFWDGKNSKSRKGLEISLLSLVDTTYNTAYSINAVQTPSELTDKESRMTHYLKQLEDNISEMMGEVLKVLNPDKHLLILNAYSLGFSSIIIENFLRSYAKQHQSALQTGELFLQAKSGVKLPLGVWGRLTK